jgi:hypothetical protein
MLDLYSVKGLSRKELEDLLYKNAHIEMNTKSQLKTAKMRLLKRINRVYTETIKQMEESFLLKIPYGLIGKKWNSVDEFLDFMEEIAHDKNHGYSKIINCAILKTMSAIEDIIDNPRVTELDKELENITEKIKSIKGLKITSQNDSGFSFVYNSPNKTEPIHVR